MGIHRQGDVSWFLLWFLGCLATTTPKRLAPEALVSHIKSGERMLKLLWNGWDGRSTSNQQQQPTTATVTATVKATATATATTTTTTTTSSSSSKSNNNNNNETRIIIRRGGKATRHMTKKTVPHQDFKNSLSNLIYPTKFDFTNQIQDS